MNRIWNSNIYGLSKALYSDLALNKSKVKVKVL